MQAELYDAAVFEHLAKVAQQIPPSQYGGQAIGVMLNAYTRSPHLNLALFRCARGERSGSCAM